MPNEEMLLDALAWVRHQNELQLEGKPSEWDQTTFLGPEFETLPESVSDPTDCGTVCCVAGHIALIQPGNTVKISRYSPGSDYITVDLYDSNGTEISDIGYYARQLLGIEEWQAEMLFSASNDLDRIQEIVIGIIDGTLENEYDYDDDW